ncbi:Mediator of RNA polymerase II transcription subunit 34 [Dendrobium catenatum]|uniref:ATP-dependent DNA helicase n=1 Tax=Dendrobium catenatum TaxID=906689 RepID=A0A2I0VJH5_9ASPA|nr:Mediator of RNA polymerase II transcription subunit 34 [Dendrobium catenatum]
MESILKHDKPSLFVVLWQHNFGYSQFRPSQKEIIQKVLEGTDCLVVMATGGGKSLCYQVPPLVTGKTAVVISPLLSLMQDQVMALKQRGIKAEHLGSSQTDKDAYSQAERGVFDVLYMTPEKACLLPTRFWSNLLNSGICLLAVDEAHCISEWGHDFRQEYKQLDMLRGVLLKVPFMGLTATATEKYDMVRNDIVQSLKMTDPFISIGSFDRKNLFYGVKPYHRSQLFMDELVKEVSKYNVSGGSVIIYCTTVKDTEQICQLLCGSGITAGMYHGQMGSKAREKSHRSDFAKADFYVADVRSEKQRKAIMESLMAAEKYCLLVSCRRRFLLQYFGEKRESDCGYLKEIADDVYRKVSVSPIGLQYLHSANFDDQPPLILALSNEMIVEEDHGQINVENIESSISLEGERFSEAEKKFYDILLHMRMELAKENGTAPYAICGDQTLIKIAKIRPSTRARLANIEGVNQNIGIPTLPRHCGDSPNDETTLRKHLVSMYGDKFLQTISNASQELDLTLNKEENAVTTTRKVYPSSEKNLNPAKFEAWKMWQMGKNSLKEVSSLGRSVPIKEQTVISYILEAAQTGCEVDWVRFCSEIGLTLEIVSQIRSAVSKIGSRDRLKPIKEELTENVSYEHIKTFVMMEDLNISADEVFGCKPSLLSNTSTKPSNDANSEWGSLVRGRAESKSSPEAVNARKQNRSHNTDHESPAKKLHAPPTDENENLNNGLEATQDSIMELINNSDGISLSEIKNFFRGSKADDVVDLLNCLETEFLIFKKNDLYRAL